MGIVHFLLIVTVTLRLKSDILSTLPGYPTTPVRGILR